MNRNFVTAAALAFMVVAGRPVAAQSTDGYWSTWVSNRFGDDRNDCSFFRPCRFLQRAHDVTRAHGSIRAAEPGDYGPVRIRKYITIDGRGFTQINAHALNGPYNFGIVVEVPPTGSGGVVTIKNLSVILPAGGFGIIADSNVHLENVTITGPASAAVRSEFTPLYDAQGELNVTARRLTIVGARMGVWAIGSSVTITDSVIRGVDGRYTGGGVSEQGILVQPSSFPSKSGKVFVERTEISFFRLAGLEVDGLTGGATARIANNVITNNYFGVLARNGGQIVSFGTNMLAGNTRDGSTSSSISPR